MVNEDHESETAIIFNRTACSVWGFDDNQYGILPNRHVWVAYSGGNRAVDLLECNPEYTTFAGRSQYGWKLRGTLLE